VPQPRLEDRIYGYSVLWGYAHDQMPGIAVNCDKAQGLQRAAD
jgi:hypothetical protein